MKRFILEVTDSQAANILSAIRSHAPADSLLLTYAGEVERDGDKAVMQALWREYSEKCPGEILRKGDERYALLYRFSQWATEEKGLLRSRIQWGRRFAGAGAVNLVFRPSKGKPIRAWRLPLT